MIDRAIDVSYETFMKHVSRDEVLALFPDYDWGKAPKDLTLKKDYAVSFHRSKWSGKRCYYIRHSAIEYIFM